MGAEIKAEKLEDEHVRKLAPFIVGPEAWPAYSQKRTYWPWPVFREFIDATFSLSRDACVDAVFDLR